MTPPPPAAPRGPAYRIDTDRLVIRCWDPGDAPALKEAIDASLPHLAPWMPWTKSEPQSVDDKLALIRRYRSLFDESQDFYHAAFDRDGRLVGAIGSHPRPGPGLRDLGYWVHAAHAGRGYATEMAAALTRVAFEIDGVVRVEIGCEPHNARSAAVPRKLGFTHEATLRQRIPTPAGWGDQMMWALLASEYPASPCIAARVAAWDALGRRLL